MVGEFIVIDFRMPFGWRNSPCWWAITASAVRHAHRNINVRNAKNVRVVRPPQNSPAVCAPPGVRVTPIEGYPVDGNFDAEMYVDNTI